MGTARARVLIVEDEPAVADSFEYMLEDEYDVETAYDGEEALDVLDDEVDVVLLDRMMPGLPGEEVLGEIRDRGVDCRVAMVTAVDPDFDIIDMGFDGYVSKPPTESELKSTVESLLRASEYGDGVREYRSLLHKRSVIEAEKTDAELTDSDEFSSLEVQIDETRDELDDRNEQLLDDETFVTALRDADPTAKGGDSSHE